MRCSPSAETECLWRSDGATVRHLSSLPPDRRRGRRIAGAVDRRERRRTPIPSMEYLVESSGAFHLDRVFDAVVAPCSPTRSPHGTRVRDPVLAPSPSTLPLPRPSLYSGST